ncbi:MAG: DNA primase family protein [Solirubrobacteraceae bacterium]
MSIAPPQPQPAAPMSAAQEVAAALKLACDESDMGNARRLVLDHRHVLRHVPGLDWFHYSGTHWERDVDGQAMRLAKETVRSILDEANTLYAAAARLIEPDPYENAQKKAGARLAHAKRSQNQPRLEALLTCASTEPELVLTADKLDADPWLLNTPNGTIDLRTGNVREHVADDHITKITGTTIEPMATPRWDAYLATTFGGDIALIDCFQRRIGYTLSGDTREQVMFLAVGDGENGKTTGMEAIAAMAGDYATAADPATFTTAASDRAARSDLARLRGARLVSGDEIDTGAQLAESLVKRLTGGDRITARFLYRDEFEFRPVMKLWLTVNRLPRVDGDDHAIWRRLQVIPFTVRIQRPDKALPRKLRAELPGILAWAVRGCLEWQRDGLGTCGAIDHAAARYRRREDRVGLFLDECCELDATARVENGTLRDAYQEWERARGGKPATDLFDRLDKRGFHAGKSNGQRVRKGLKLVFTDASTDAAGTGRDG